MITSKENSRVKYLTKLKNKKTIYENSEFLVEGSHLVNEALKHGYLKETFSSDESIEGATLISKEIMKKITSLDNPPKVIGLCKLLDKNKIEGNILVLDKISDPGNLGTLIRSAVAFNYKTLILSNNSVSIYNPKVIRATEGMIFNINIIESDINKNINTLKEKGYYIYGTDVKEGKEPSPTKEKHALIIGSEAKGIDNNLKSLIDKNLYINMNKDVESLNAGVSGSILMYILNK